MNEILVIVEHDGRELQAATLHSVAAAAEIGGSIDLLVSGVECKAVAAAAAAVAGVRKILVADDSRYAHCLAENLALLVAEVGRRYSHVLAPATTFGKNFMPRTAALLDVAQISDIVGVESADTFVRPIYAGNALAAVRSSDPVKLITVRTSVFATASATGGNATVEWIAPAQSVGGVKFLQRDLSTSERPELSDARIVVAGGRGFGNAENFQLLGALADRLGAAVGASRAAVDAGFIGNDHQVGQTGKVVAPELYMAIGISGAVQHLAGMLESRVIVAINNDPDAPIFEVADYGLVGDLLQILPEIMAALEGECS